MENNHSYKTPPLKKTERDIFDKRLEALKRIKQVQGYSREQLRRGSANYACSEQMQTPYSNGSGLYTAAIKDLQERVEQETARRELSDLIKQNQHYLRARPANKLENKETPSRTQYFGIKPVRSAAPGQLLRPDLKGKPQYVPSDIDEVEELEGEDVIGNLIPSMLEINLERGLTEARSNWAFDSIYCTSLQRMCDDIGTDGKNIFTVKGKKSHCDPLESEQYQEDLIPMMEKAAEGFSRRH